MILQHNVSNIFQIIWTLIFENQFAKKMQKILNKFEQIFERIHVYNHVKNQTFFENYQLSRNIEYQLTQNLTFIVVHEKSVHIVFATTIEKTIV